MIPFFQQCESLADFERMINTGSERYMESTAANDGYFHIMASYLASRDRFDEVVKKWAILSDTRDMRELLAYLNGSPN